MTTRQNFNAPRSCHIVLILLLAIFSLFALSCVAAATNSPKSSFFSSLPIKLRRLAGDGDDEWARPPNAAGNYSVWGPQLDERLEDSCISFDGTFESGVKVDERGPSQSLFEGLKWEDKIHYFEDVVSSDFESEEMSEYLGSKGAWIAFIVIGVATLIVVLGIFFTFIPSCRKCCAKKCCCCCKSGDQGAKGSDSIVYSPVLTGLIVGIFLIAFMLSFGIVCSVKAANFSKGLQASFCDAFLTMKGYWFGATAVQPGPMMVSDWKGSHIQWEEMQELSVKVTPGDDNPMKKMVVDHYYGYVKPELQNASDFYINAINNQYIPYFTDLDAFLKDLVSQTKIAPARDSDTGGGYPTPKTDLWWAYGALASSSLRDYATDLAATTELGFHIIEGNIEQYLGDDSLLFQEAELSAVNALASLDDVNYSLAGLLADVVHAQDAMGTMLDLSVAGLATWAALSFCLLITGVILYGMLFSSARKGETPSKMVVRGFCGLFVCAALFSATSLIISGSFFLVGNVGGDACMLLDETIMKEGNWAALPTRMWNETLHGTTDMMSALDTCVKTSGHGDVATALGLTADLNRLEQTLDKTKEELRAQVDTYLQLDLKIVKSASIGKMLRESAYFLWPKRNTNEVNYIEEDVVDVEAVEGTRYVIPQALTPALTPVRVLCALPAMASGNRMDILTLCGENFVFNAIGSGTLMDIISAKAAKYATAGNHKWCMASLKDDPNYPEGCAADAIIIDHTWPVDRTLYDNADVAAVRDSMTKAADPETEQRKWMDAVYTAVHLEVALNHKLTKNDKWPNLACPNEKEECTFKEFLPFLFDKMSAFGDDLMSNVDHTAMVVNEFVEDITIGSMEMLLEEGRAALANFNCQFVGTSLTHGLNYGLCNVTMPSAAMLALCGSMFFVACLAVAIITWLNWDNLHRMTMRKEGDYSSPAASISNNKIYTQRSRSLSSSSSSSSSN